jgi:diacylglycerol O-acyltransferase
VTNIPGPQLPLYVQGRELQDLFPLAFLPKGHALAVAIMSYNGQIGYGLLGDYDALPDIDLIAEGLDQALDELLAAARSKTAASPNGARKEASAANGQRQKRSESEVPILPGPGARPARGPAADMRAKRARRPRAPRPSPGS